MIEKYYYSIPKYKKVIFAILIGLLFISLFSFKTKSGFFSWAAQQITDNITNEIFESCNQACSEAVGYCLDAASNVLTSPWGPQVNTFNNLSNFGGAYSSIIISDFGVWIGIFLATIIYFFSMFVYIFSGKITDSKDTPISLTGKYIVAMAICYKLTSIINTFLDIIDTINTGYVSIALTNVMSGAQGGFLKLLGEAIDGWIASLLVNMAVTTLIPGGAFLLLIVTIVIIWKVVKGLFKLYAEMISRYIVSIFLLLLFAGFAGTLVSNNTSQIFKSYLRTLFSSFVVLIFNILWFKLCLLTLCGMVLSFSILQYFFLLELMAFGLKIDGILRSMGLGVATGGARIASACGGAGRNLANSLRNANDLRKAGGNLLKEAGAGMAAKGDPKGLSLFQAGSSLGASTDDILKGKADPNNSMFNLASKLGAEGMKMNDNLISGKQAAGIMSKAMANPNDKDAQNAMKSLSNKKLAEGAQEIMGDKYKVNGASYAEKFGADGQRHSGVRVNASSTGDGSMAGKEAAEHGKSVNGVLSGEGMFAEGKGETFSANGDSFTMKADEYGNSMHKGDYMAVNEGLEEVAGTAASDAIDAAQNNGADINGLSYEGNNNFRTYDDDGNISGVVRDGEFIGNSANDSEAQEKLLGQASDELSRNGVTDLSDWKETDEGKWEATGTLENGTSKTFAATDVGTYPNASKNDDTYSMVTDWTDDDGNRRSMVINASNDKGSYSDSNYQVHNEPEYHKGYSEEDQVADENRGKYDETNNEKGHVKSEKKGKRR